MAAVALTLAGQTVVLDPGHNGANASHPKRINRQVDVGQGMRKACDTTGTATASGYAESAYTLAVARETARILRRHGAEVVLTRDDDAGVGPCITRRARIGNREQADAAVSIHADGGPAGGRGFHVIRPTLIDGLTDDIYADSRRLGRVLRAAYEERTGLPRATYAGGNGLVRARRPRRPAAVRRPEGVHRDGQHAQRRRRPQARVAPLPQADRPRDRRGRDRLPQPLTAPLVSPRTRWRSASA